MNSLQSPNNSTSCATWTIYTGLKQEHSRYFPLEETTLDWIDTVVCIKNKTKCKAQKMSRVKQFSTSDWQERVI